MGALVAIVDLSGKANVIPAAIQMMSALRHRGSDEFGIATATKIITSRSIDDLQGANLDSPIAVGYNLEEILEKDIPQPISNGDLKFVFEGRVYPADNRNDACRAAFALVKSRLDGAHFVDSTNGSYVFAGIYEGSLFVGRDPVGCRPLYEGRKEELVAFASEKRAISSVNIPEYRVFPPGLCVKLQKSKEITYRSHTPADNETGLDLESATRRLSKVLLKSLSDRIGDAEDIAVAYSGGLDSGLLAASLKLLNRHPRLLHVATTENRDLEQASQSAKELGLRLDVWRLSESEVVDAIRDVLFRIDDTNPLNIAIALPAYFVSRFARKLGLPVVLFGQGADELFGGYSRYLTILENRGEKAVKEAMREDVMKGYRLNYQRDEQAGAGAHVEFRFPFADRELIDFCLSLPLEYRISHRGPPVRKFILRKLAEIHGAPPSISASPKRAVQYSTGIDALIKKVAARSGLPLRDYLSNLAETPAPLASR
ncbi:MAG: asparagine synthetase B [archaeon]